MRTIRLLITLLGIGFSGYSQSLRVVDPKGHVWRAYQVGVELQLIMRQDKLEKRTIVGQLTAMRLDTIHLTDQLGMDQRAAVSTILGVRVLPTLLTGAAAGAALGATTITLVDKRSLSTAPRIGLSLLLGAGVGMGVAYWKRTHQRKQMRHRPERGWSFQVR